MTYAACLAMLSRRQPLDLLRLMCLDVFPIAFCFNDSGFKMEATWGYMLISFQHGEKERATFCHLLNKRMGVYNQYCQGHFRDVFVNGALVEGIP